ncbi:MAG: TM2 domain-containing protein [Chloroflexi bacterium]|nr:TM2 domain-containing protein [Chloroflexota bacterium]
MADIIHIMPELDGEEMLFVGGLIRDMSDDQARTFATAYRSQRRDPTNVLLLTLLGFVIIAGVQRFYLGQIGMGLVYLFTAGFCLIGTIIDLVNHKSLAFKYNQEKAQTLSMTVRSSTGP